MDFDPNWLRWIKASVAKHFEDAHERFFVEGFDRNTEGLPDWIELRSDGPYIKETTKGDWQLSIEINILIMVNEQNDPYMIERIKGKVAASFLDCLEVYRYGEGVEDDNTLLGCFKIKQEGREKIIVTDFGKVKPNVSQFQASIEAHYVMNL